MIAVSTSIDERPATAVLPDLYEIVDGQVKEIFVGARQMSISSRFNVLLSNFAEPLQLGQVVLEMLFHLREGYPQRRPDVAFVSADRWPHDLDAPESNAWPVVPDLVVEVVSPTNTFDEIHIKNEEYFQAGVRLVWVVSTRMRFIQVYTDAGQFYQLGMNDTLTGDPVLPGFTLPLKNLFSKRYS